MGHQKPEAGARPSLRGKFLLASQNLRDVHFSKTIVLIVRHDEEGALGFVMNRPLGVTLDEAISQQIDAARGVGLTLFHGGPCPGYLVALHNVAELGGEGTISGEFNSGELADLDQETWGEPVSPGVWLSSRREVLEALMRHVAEVLDSGDEEARRKIAVKFALGYAAWEGGQLERELSEGSWLVSDASIEDIYAGGSPGFPPQPATTSLPQSALGLLALLADAVEGGHDPTPGLAAGIRQWVRLSTRANIAQLIDPRLIPPDATVN
jgi:putative transcriptional regulator